MIPFQKILALVIRTFSKPMLGWLQKSQKQNKMTYTRWIFVAFGRRYHHFEHWLNHTVLKTTHKRQIAQLKEQILLEKGIWAFYQLIFYSIVIGIPLYQLHQGSLSSHKKEQQLQNSIARMELQLKEANLTLEKTLRKVKERNDQRSQLTKQFKIRLELAEKQREVKANRAYQAYLEEKQESERKQLQKRMKSETEFKENTDQGEEGVPAGDARPGEGLGEEQKSGKEGGPQQNSK